MNVAWTHIDVFPSIVVEIRKTMTVHQQDPRMFVREPLSRDLIDH